MAHVRILVVEDEATVATTIQDVLMSFGYDVPAICCSGDEAIQKAAEIRPDVVIMDIRLQGPIDGVEAAERISSGFNIPIVYLTGYSDDDIVRDAVLTEPFGYVMKPFKARELYIAVELALYKHKMQMKLKENEQLIFTILENIGDAVVSIDIDGYINFMNLAAGKLIYYTRKDTIGKVLTKVFCIINDQKQPLTRSHLTNILRNGIVDDFAHYTGLIVKDGAEVFIESSATLIKDPNGYITGAVIVFRDTTERKRAGAALRASEARTRLIFENALDAVITADQHGLIVDWNPQAEATFGWSRQEVLGQPLAETIIPPAYREAHKRGLQRFLSTGEGPVLNKRVEIMALHRAGHEFPVELAISPMCVGQTFIFSAFIRDITERKRAEAALRESEARFRDLVEGSIQGVIVHSHFQPLFVNHAYAAMFGYTPEEILAMESTLPLFPEHEHQRLQSCHEARLQGKPIPAHNEFQGVRRDGAVIWLEGRVRVVDWAGTRATQATVVDITERKQAEEDLRARARQQALVAKLGQHALAGTDLSALMGEAAAAIAQSLGVRYSEALELLRDGDALVEYRQAATRFSGPALWYDHGVGNGTSVIIPGPNHPCDVPGMHTTKRRTFAGNDCHFLQSVANTLAAATERQRTEEYRTRLIERVMSAQEEERRRIARELHDETGQSLTFLLVGLRLIEDTRTLRQAKTRISQLRDLTVQILDNLRRLARGLHPSVLDDLGLVVALTRYATDYAQSHGIAINVHTEGLDSDRLLSPVEMALYRIMQEALTNIARHAAAKTVRIALIRRPSAVWMVVEDDGCGFDVETTFRTSATSGHLGLYSMRERVTLLGGSVAIKSGQGEGTIVSLQIPLPGPYPYGQERADQ